MTGKTSSKRSGRSTSGRKTGSKRSGRSRQHSGKAKTARRAAPRPRVQIRTSERTSFERCKWQWDRGYNDRLKPVEEAPALRFGSLVHAALEERYPPGIKRGPKPAQTFEKLFEADLKEAEKTWGFRDEDGDWAEAGQLGVCMLEEYINVYGRDEEWKVIASELTFSVPVYGRQEKNEEGLLGLWVPCQPDDDDAVYLFDYVGTMDGVWQDRISGGVRVNDYKTTKGDPVKEAMGKLLLDEQGTAYWTWGVDYLLAENILKAKQKQLLDGMLYTFLRKAKKDTRPQNSKGQYLNQDGSVSKKQPGEYFHREIVYRDREQSDRARQRAIDQFFAMQDIREGKARAYKSPGTGFPDQQCKACAFFDICELNEIGADWEQMRDASMKKWDPYAAHEIQEEGKY
jgi:hypothetical protein